RRNLHRPRKSRRSRRTKQSSAQCRGIREALTIDARLTVVRQSHRGTLAVSGPCLQNGVLWPFMVPDVDRPVFDLHQSL
ncbi:MAG: hypothetical protein WBE99_00735, partial [Xanthobacteraceae bacterium]